MCDQALKDAVRNNTPLSVILLDIDYFKAVNDAHGHLAGDAVLKDIAKVLLDAVRSNDVVARWGGEEMLVVAKGCDLNTAMQLAEKIRAQIAAHEFAWGGATFKVTASFGVAQVTTRENRAALFARADRALYVAKESGRNRIERAAFTPL